MRSITKFCVLCWLPFSSAAGAIFYDRPVESLGSGQSLGNLNTYVTLDRETNVADYPSTVRRGFRESTNQRYYALGWTLEMSDGANSATPMHTSFYPAYQQTLFRVGDGNISKKFFLPFEIGYARAGHYLLERENGGSSVRVRSRLLLPAGATVETSDFKGWKYALIRYDDGGTAILWGTSQAAALTSKSKKESTELTTDYDWTGPEAFALSFLYSPGNQEHAANMLLNAAFDANMPDAPSRALHLFRVRHLLNESEQAIGRYLQTAQLITPDGVINRANAWGKITQLRLQSEYRGGRPLPTIHPPIS